MKKSSTKPSKSQLTLDKAPQNYTLEFGNDAIELIVADGDIWASQKDIAEMFQVETSTVNYHIGQLYASGEAKESTIRKIRIVAPDGKQREVNHYSTDIIFPVGYRVGSPQASAFRAKANEILREVALMSMVIHEKQSGSKELRKMGNDLTLAEKYGLSENPHIVRLSKLYENKLGEELLFAIIADICVSPNYGQIKGAEYKYLFDMFADDLKKALGSDKIRPSLPDRQLQAFTLAEATLRMMLENNKSMTNEQVLEAVKLAFQPIGVYLRSTSQLMGLHHVTDKPLLTSGKDKQ